MKIFFFIINKINVEIEFKVVQVKSFGGYVVHIGYLMQESSGQSKLLVNDVLRLEIDQVCHFMNY